MIIKVLAENTAVSDAYKAEHGLSLHIEMRGHKILFDMGKSTIFAENAKHLGVDLAEVDIAMISHGHYDHGGGLASFLELNDTAPVYIQNGTFSSFYAQGKNGQLEYIGLQKNLFSENENRFRIAEEFLAIDDDVEIFSGIVDKTFFPSANEKLFTEQNGMCVADDFMHEQNLILTEGHMSVLIVGCAHNGILSIINRFFEIKGKTPDVVIGGFHLGAPKAPPEPPEIVAQIAEQLKQSPTLYFTCHCTGAGPYTQLKKVMKNRLYYLSAGCVLDLDQYKSRGAL